MTVKLKLAKLPAREPVKMTISLPPDISAALDDYADIYEAVYGQREAVPDLIPFLLRAFLDGDRDFARARVGRGMAN